MRLTALQLPARFDAASAQLALVEELLLGGPVTDLVLLPEASLTGYVSPRGDFDLTRFAEPIDGPTRAALCRLAERFDCLVIGPLIERDGRDCFNSMVGVTPGGELLVHYRKRHPWIPEEWATPGAITGPLYAWRGLRMTAGICFDIHFVDDDEETAAALGAADLLLFPSAWSDDSDTLPPILSRVAAHHGIAVLNANWGPGEPRFVSQGGSMLVDDRGVVRARLAAPVGRLDVRWDPR